jgi:hypothetical protein
MKTNVLGHEIVYDGTDEDRTTKVAGLSCNKKKEFHEAFDLDPVTCPLEKELFITVLEGNSDSLQFIASIVGIARESLTGSFFIRVFGTSGAYEIRSFINDNGEVWSTDISSDPIEINKYEVYFSINWDGITYNSEPVVVNRGIAIS